MPSRPGATCPSCRQPVARGARCQCKAKRPARDNPYNSTAHLAWRAAVLARDQICVMCNVLPSKVADHWPQDRRELVAAGIDPAGDPAHGRGLCLHCNARQTAERQPGGFNLPGWRRSG